MGTGMGLLCLTNNRRDTVFVCMSSISWLLGNAAHMLLTSCETCISTNKFDACEKTCLIAQFSRRLAIQRLKAAASGDEDLPQLLTAVGCLCIATCSHMIRLLV